MNVKKQIRKKRIVTFLNPEVWKAIERNVPFGDCESEKMRLFCNKAVEMMKHD